MRISQTPTIMATEKAEELAERLQQDNPEWTYVVERHPAHRKTARIRVQKGEELRVGETIGFI